jgi:hypothetical protein
VTLEHGLPHAVHDIRSGVQTGELRFGPVDNGGGASEVKGENDAFLAVDGVDKVRVGELILLPVVRIRLPLDILMFTSVPRRAVVLKSRYEVSNASHALRTLGLLTHPRNQHLAIVVVDDFVRDTQSL